MPKNLKRLILGVGLLSLLFGVVCYQRYWHRNPEKLDPLWEVPDFEMTAVTSAGAGPITKKDLMGRPWVADFIYTSCAGPCPLLSARMAQLQKLLPKQVRLVSFTVDPLKDKIPVLKRYAVRYHANPERWIFVRGEPDALFRLVHDGFRLALVEDPRAPAGYRVTHSTKLVLVDSEGTIRCLYDGNSPGLAHNINRDVHRLLVGL